WIGLLIRARDRVVRRVDQAAQQRLLLHDAYVLFDGRRVRHADDQLRQISDAANRLEFLLLDQRLGEGDRVDRLSVLVQFEHPREDAAVRVEVEIVRFERLGGFVRGKIVQQDRTQNGAFRLDARRHAPVDGSVFSGRQRELIVADIAAKGKQKFLS